MNTSQKSKEMPANEIRKSVPRSKTETWSAILTGALGIYYVILALQNVAILDRVGLWVPLSFVVTGIGLLISVVAFARGDRRGLLIFLVPFLIMVARLFVRLTTPVGYLDTFATLDYLLGIAYLVVFIVAAALIAIVMWFQRKWLSILGLGLASLLLLPTLTLSLIVLVSNALSQ